MKMFKNLSKLATPHIPNCGMWYAASLTVLAFFKNRLLRHVEQKPRLWS